MEENRVFITIDVAGVAEQVEDRTPALDRIREKLDCSITEIVRSSVLDAGSDRRLVLLVDDSGALKPDRKFNPVASSACGRIIYGTVAFGEEIDGPDGGEIVGLQITDEARVLAFMGAVRAFMIRDASTFMHSMISALTLGMASTIPAVVDLEGFRMRIQEVVNAEYESILARLKAEYADLVKKGGADDEA